MIISNSKKKKFPLLNFNNLNSIFLSFLSTSVVRLEIQKNYIKLLLPMNTHTTSPWSTQQNQISWVRKRDWHILSSGSQMYTNDERFAILHATGSNIWTLQIKFVQHRDHGVYECQVSQFTRLLFRLKFILSALHRRGWPGRWYFIPKDIRRFVLARKKWIFNTFF